MDLTELSRLGDHKKLGESTTNVLLQDCNSSHVSLHTMLISHTKVLLDELANMRQRQKWEKNMPKEDLHIKQAAALVVKLEGNSLFSLGNITGIASKYTKALALCPVRSKKESPRTTIMFMFKLFP